MAEDEVKVLDKLRSKYWRRQTSAFQNERVIPIITGGRRLALSRLFQATAIPNVRGPPAA